MVTPPAGASLRTSPHWNRLEQTGFSHHAPDEGAGLCLGARMLEKHPRSHTRLTLSEMLTKPAAETTGTRTGPRRDTAAAPAPEV